MPSTRLERTSRGTEEDMVLLKHTWRGLLLRMGATLGLAGATPGPALGVAVGTANGVASAPNQESAPQPERAEGRLWYSVAEDTLAAPDPSRRIESGRYRTVGLDRGKLADLLARAPLEQTEEARKTEVVMELPWPDGSFKRFRIEEASISEPGLTVRCADLKTYRGRGADATRAYVRFDWSRSGFYAMVDSGEGQVVIDPYSPGDTRNYLVYYARDWRPGPERTEGTSAGRQAAPAPPPAGSASPAESAAASIEEIAIERRCFACEKQYRLTLRRDGTGILMVVGVLGVEHVCQGRVTAEDFARLAALIEREGFFELNEVYRDPRIADGSGAITTAVVDGRRKAVHNVNQAGPPNLKAAEHAVDQLGNKTAWRETRP